MPLPTMTSGRSAERSTFSAFSTSSGMAWVRGGSGQRPGSSTSRLTDFSGNDVVRHVEVARTDVRRSRSDCHLDIERDAVDVLVPWANLQNGVASAPGSSERPHTVAPGFRRAPMRIIGQPFCCALARPASAWTTPGDPRGRRRGASSDRRPAPLRADCSLRMPTGDPFLLRGRGDRLHRKPTIPNMNWTPCFLRLSRLRCAVDFGHEFLLVRLGPKIAPPEAESSPRNTWFRRRRRAKSRAGNGYQARSDNRAAGKNLRAPNRISCTVMLSDRRAHSPAIPVPRRLGAALGSRPSDDLVRPHLARGPPRAASMSTAERQWSAA